MKDAEVKLGQIVLSMQGRDQGMTAVVVEIIDGNYVKIADGTQRRTSNPKLKKIKHLKRTSIIVEELKLKLENGQSLTDGMVAKAIKGLQETEGENV